MFSRDTVSKNEDNFSCSLIYFLVKISENLAITRHFREIYLEVCTKILSHSSLYTILGQLQKFKTKRQIPQPWKKRLCLVLTLNDQH